nr:hypothetical protein [Tanacetum cinerariifolium]
KGTKREVFGMPIPGRLITADIREASYYQENMAKHRGFLAGDTWSTQDLPAPKLTKPARKPSISIPVASTQPAPISAPAKSQEYKRKQATETTDKPAKAKRFKRSISRQTRQPRSSPKSAMEESMKVAYALPKGPLLPVVIKELESGKYQPLPEVPGKGEGKVTEEQVSHDLLSLQKHKKTSLVDQYILQRRVSEPTESSFHDESPYDVLGQSDSEEESEMVALGAKRVVKMKVRLDQTLMHKLKTRRDQTLVLKLKARLDQTLMKPLKARLDQALMKHLKARLDQTLVMLKLEYNLFQVLWFTLDQTVNTWILMLLMFHLNLPRSN